MFQQEVQKQMYQNKYIITMILVDFCKWKIVTTNAEIRMKRRNDMMCCVFPVTFASEAEPQLFLACS